MRISDWSSDVCSSDLFDVELLETSALARVGADMNMVGIDLRRAALSESASVVAETLPRVKAVMADVGDSIADLDSAVTDPRVRAELDRFSAAREQLRLAYTDIDRKSTRLNSSH